MGRVLAFDIGKKRTGVAVTDPLKIIATSLETIDSSKIWPFIDAYLLKENVEEIVVGNPKKLNNESSESAPLVVDFIAKWKNKHPDIPVVLIDERFTSKIAFQSLIDGGVKKKDRRDKAKLDVISAVLILQTYLLQKK